MGRGRQKAKHTKVARDLKYFSPDTNYGALERELTHASEQQPDYIDKWGDLAEVPAGTDPIDDADIDDNFGLPRRDVEPSADESSAPQSKSA
ncbi:MAG: hypothetical protein JWL94_145 [Microbacteriaceae bacterium]|jgi:hypothetical protein|nr:hypothetical protein [Microbacteriaceae bacterium]HEV7957064.1 DUF3073 domain-containing protein [Marisediminicola sp.]